MRQRRNEALQALGLENEIPFCPEEGDMELLTNSLDNIYIRRVDANLYNVRKRRLGSRKIIEQKDIDDVVVKALLRLNNAVSDCFSLKHQTNVNRQITAMRKIRKDSRDRKAKEILNSKVLEEAQIRTKIRNDKIEMENAKRIKQTAAKVIKEREEEIKMQLRAKNKKVLETAEHEYEAIAQAEADENEENRRMRKLLRKNEAEIRRKEQREEIQNSIAQIRRGLDLMDSALDKGLIRKQ